jgi:hypothetical protein
MADTSSDDERIELARLIYNDLTGRRVVGNRQFAWQTACRLSGLIEELYEERKARATTERVVEPSVSRSVVDRILSWRASAPSS